ncbi:MAG: PriCT-2 domain-containing protein, partial [Rhodospirillaceae bacterium]
SIKEHWAAKSFHDVGFILGPHNLVLDADTPQAVEALEALEAEHGIVPSIIVKTRRGVHHHFRIKAGVMVKTNSHATVQYPTRIDMKANRSMVILPPSRDKQLEMLTVSTAAELTEVGQKFVDAIYRHNGQVPLSERLDKEPVVSTDVAPLADTGELHTLLFQVDPDSGYDDWLHCLMAVFHETDGSAEGLELVNEWSKKGGKYNGRAELETKWKSFRTDTGNPVTIASLVRLAQKADQFEVCETKVIEPSENDQIDAKPQVQHPLAQYSLKGKSAEFAASVGPEAFCLGRFAMRGEATAFYAAPSSGKTIITIHAVREAVKSNQVDPDKVYYFNADDSRAGIAQKLALFDELGCHMVTPYEQGFSVDKLWSALSEMTQSPEYADGSVIILDTVKKFINLMDKTKSAEFGKLVRAVTGKNASVIALGHTTKNPGPDGSLKYQGTTDLYEDFDRAYFLKSQTGADDPNERLVTFEVFKARMGGSDPVTYRFDGTPGLSFKKRLSTVQYLSPDDQAGRLREARRKADEPIVLAISEAIKAGVNKKMDLLKTVKQETGHSRDATEKVLNTYAGDDPSRHKWRYNVGAKGAHIFSLLEE